MTRIRQIQERVLLSLVRKAERTSWGQQYHFKNIRNYNDFRDNVPVSNYDSLKPFIEKIKNGEPDILWPGQINNFAVSSGTTGSGKHLPLSDDRLYSDRRFMRKLIGHFIARWPEPQIWLGKQASLPGSVEELLINERSLTMGEISGFTAMMAPRWLARFQVISPNKLSRMSWSDKFSTCIQRAINEDVRVITAVPSWTLIFLQEAVRLSEYKSIADIWPNLKLIVSGGVALSNYRSAIEELCAPLTLQFVESYGASEGYFAFTQLLNRPPMQLVTDNGVFYEWVPYESGLSETGLAERALPTWETETKQEYIMLVTTNSGLWRYPVNDIIRFTNNTPPCLEIRGRVSEMFDDYGEAVHYSELLESIVQLETKVGGNHIQLIVSVKPPDTGSPPHHLWLIIWNQKPSVDETRFAMMMDETLSTINRHYAIRRESEALAAPEVLYLKPADQYKLLKDHENRSAQSKPVLTISYCDLKSLLGDSPLI